MAVLPIFYKHKYLMALFEIQCTDKHRDKNGAGKGYRWKQNRSKHLC